MTNVTDSDLDDLLDDALLDFDKTPKPPNTTPIGKRDPINYNSFPGNSNSINPTALFSQFFDEETTKNLQTEWDNALNELKNEDPELMANIQSQINGSAPTNIDETKDESLKESLKSTFDAMTKDMKNKKQSNSSGDGLGESFAGMNIEDDDFLKKEVDMMEGLMATMLSKSMMYEPLKDLCLKFPSWLDKNENKISEEELDSYKNQLKCLKKICEEFEGEKDEDSEAIKSERSRRIIAIVDEMHGYGDPPEELVEKSDLMGQLPSLDHLSSDQCIIS